jgi:hypothetical protein
LQNACWGGHKELARLMIDKGATDFKYSLWNACAGGHKELVDYMIEQGATDWNGGFTNACRYGHLALIRYMLEKGATDWKEGFDHCLYCPPQLECAEFLIQQGLISQGDIKNQLKKMRDWGDFTNVKSVQFLLFYLKVDPDNSDITTLSLRKKPLSQWIQHHKDMIRHIQPHLLSWLSSDTLSLVDRYVSFPWRLK